MEEIITEVLQRMPNLALAQSKELEKVLYMVLGKYEVRQKTTDLQCVDDSWKNDLNRFLIRKRIDGKSDRTIELYRYHLTRLLCYLNKPIKDIRESDLIGYIAMYKSSRGVSNRYIDDIRLIILSFFSWQCKKGFIEKNPTVGLEPIKIEKRIRKPFTDEELEKIKTICKNERDIALVEFLYSTGVRVSELTALNISDIDLNTKSVIVYGKGSKERETYLTATACMYIKRYIAQRKDDNPSLFVSVRSPHKRLTAQSVEKMLNRLGSRCGVDRVHPHRFRRTMAINVLKKGMPLEEVKELLGHVKLDTTMIYCTVSKENVRYSHQKFMCA